jgi:transposase
MTTAREGGATGRVYAALELSSSKWVVAVRCSGEEGTSLFQLAGGDLAGLLSLLGRKRAAAEQRGASRVEVCTCYEAGYDGFWLHRALQASGVRNVVLDSASIQINRRRKRVKTDRTDARGMLMVLLAFYRGEDQACSTVRVPTEEEEDRKRVIRSRESLLKERVRRVNRIRGLLHLQGVRHLRPNRANWEADLKALKTADGRAFPLQLLREIRREAVLLATVQRLLREIDEDVRAMSQANAKAVAQRRRNPIATRLAAIRGIGAQTAAVLATELFYRSFRNRREVASYVGLTPTPYASGGVSRDQGISKAGNRRARRDAIELAWLWLKHQPDTALSAWFRRRVAEGRGRVRRIAIAALARRIIVALWRYLEQGLIPQGAVMKA